MRYALRRIWDLGVPKEEAAEAVVEVYQRAARAYCDPPRDARHVVRAPERYYLLVRKGGQGVRVGEYAVLGAVAIRWSRNEIVSYAALKREVECMLLAAAVAELAAAGVPRIKLRYCNGGCEAALTLGFKPKAGAYEIDLFFLI